MIYSPGPSRSGATLFLETVYEFPVTPRDQSHGFLPGEIGVLPRHHGAPETLPARYKSNETWYRGGRSQPYATLQIVLTAAHHQTADFVPTFTASGSGYPLVVLSPVETSTFQTSGSTPAFCNCSIA